MMILKNKRSLKKKNHSLRNKLNKINQLKIKMKIHFIINEIAFL